MNKRQRNIVYPYIRSASDIPPVLMALTVMAAKNPGLDPRDYGFDGQYSSPNWFSCYRGDSRRITKQLHDVTDAVESFYYLDGTDSDLIDASKSAYSGRLDITVTDGVIDLDYCSGQYYPTEYRQCIAAIINQAVSKLQRKAA